MLPCPASAPPSDAAHCAPARTQRILQELGLHFPARDKKRLLYLYGKEAQGRGNEAQKSLVHGTNLFCSSTYVAFSQCYFNKPTEASQIALSICRRWGAPRGYTQRVQQQTISLLPRKALCHWCPSEHMWVSGGQGWMLALCSSGQCLPRGRRGLVQAIQDKNPWGAASCTHIHQNMQVCDICSHAQDFLHYKAMVKKAQKGTGRSWMSSACPAAPANPLLPKTRPLPHPQGEILSQAKPPPRVGQPVPRVLQKPERNQQCPLYISGLGCCQIPLHPLLHSMRQSFLGNTRRVGRQLQTVQLLSFRGEKYTVHKQGLLCLHSKQSC